MRPCPPYIEKKPSEGEFEARLGRSTQAGHRGSEPAPFFRFPSERSASKQNDDDATPEVQRDGARCAALFTENV